MKTVVRTNCSYYVFRFIVWSEITLISTNLSVLAHVYVRSQYVPLWCGGHKHRSSPVVSTFAQYVRFTHKMPLEMSTL